MRFQFVSGTFLPFKYQSIEFWVFLSTFISSFFLKSWLVLSLFMLLDFVPEKVKAEDALAQLAEAEK